MRRIVDILNDALARTLPVLGGATIQCRHPSEGGDMKAFWKLLLLVAAGGPLAPTAFAQDPDAGDPWESLRYFVGAWKGTGTGLGGEATLEHRYRFVLQDKFLHTTTRSVFPATEERDGEIHEDWGMFSFDVERGTLVLRQFLTEGFVNTYVLSDRSDDGQRLVFTSEDSENSDFGARITYEILSPSEYEARLELAPPGKDFFECRFMRLKKVTAEP